MPGPRLTPREQAIADAQRRPDVTEGSLTTNLPDLGDTPAQLTFRAAGQPATQVFIHLGDADGPLLGCIVRSDREPGWHWGYEGPKRNVGTDYDQFFPETLREAIEEAVNAWPLYARLNGLPRQTPAFTITGVDDWREHDEPGDAR